MLRLQLQHLVPQQHRTGSRMIRVSCQCQCQAHEVISCSRSSSEISKNISLLAQLQLLSVISSCLVSAGCTS